MDTNNTMPPRAPTSPQAQPPVNPAMNSGSKNTDLYNAIAKDEPEIIITQKKKKQSPFIGLVVLFMKATFYIDSVRRSNESFFHFLGGIWAGFMGLLYLGGLVTLFLCVYARTRLPLYLESFFETHNLRYDSLKMANYSLSHIRVLNLHDDENKYVIPQLDVHSTFADFLQGRIRTVTAEGLKLNLKASKTDDDHFQKILPILSMIANPMDAGLDLKINSITINNAALNLETKNAKIPVNFSMSGLYNTKKPQVIIPFTINEDFLKMDASLTVSGTPQDRKLDLAIKSGTLTLSNRAPEELQGDVSLKTNEDKITDLSALINLNYGYSLKTIKTQLTNTDKGFKGDLAFLYKNTAEKEAKSLADFTLSVDGLLITKDGFISTANPIQMKIARLTHNTTILEGIEGTLNGEMQCNLPSIECKYDLLQDATLRYQNLALKYKEQNIVINEPGSLSFLPSANTLSLQLQDSKIGLNWELSGVDLKGFYNAETNPLHLTADNCHLAGNFSTQTESNTFDTEVKNGSYETATLAMSGVNLTAQDLYNPTAPIYFSADEIKTSSPLLRQPVSADVTYLNRQVKANLRIKNSNITFNAEGIFQPFQKTFVGQFKIPPVNLKKLPFSLHELSSVFPKSLDHVSGEISASGQLHFAGPTNIAGPFYLGLKGINFDLDNTPISQVNGVIALQSLIPLVSASNQNISIGKIDALIPLTNIKASFQLENQAVRLLTTSAILGNEELSLSSALIPYRKPSALLYLKTDKDFEITHIEPFLNLPGMLPVGGTGSIAIPVDVSENGVQLSSATLKVNNTTLRQAQDQKDIAGLFQKQNDAYMIRNGQFIFDKDKKLQLDLDGWLMPMRKREPFSKKDIQLNAPLFKSGEEATVPLKIRDRQKLLSQMLMDQAE